MSEPNLGAGSSDYSNIDRFTIVDGKWTKRVDPDTVGAKKRTLTKGENAGQEVSELSYDFYAGYLQKIQVTEGDYGRRLMLTVGTGESDDSEKAILYVKLYSSLCRSLLNQLLTANVMAPLKFNLWKKDKDSGAVLFLSEWRDEKNEKASNWWSVDMKYPWDTVNKGFKGLVEATEIEDGEGGTKWSYKAPVDYLIGEVKTEILDHIQTDSIWFTPGVESENIPATPKAPVPTPPLGGGTSEEDDDDLPF